MPICECLSRCHVRLWNPGGRAVPYNKGTGADSMLKCFVGLSILSLAALHLAQEVVVKQGEMGGPLPGRRSNIAEFRGPFHIPTSSTGYAPVNWHAKGDGCEVEVGMLRHGIGLIGLSVDVTSMGKRVGDPLLILAYDRDSNKLALRSRISQQAYRIDGNRWGFEASKRAEVPLPGNHAAVIEVRWPGHLLRSPELRP